MKVLETTTMPLNEILCLGDQEDAVNGELTTRNLNNQKVADYSENMRCGDVFPPLRLNAETKVIVGGNTRYKAYCQVFEPTHEVPVELVEYENKGEQLYDAIYDNRDHGSSLSPYEKNANAIKLRKYGYNDADICKLFSISTKKLEKWMKKRYGVKQDDGEVIEYANKNGNDYMDGRLATNKQHNTIKTIRGFNVKIPANEVVRRVDSEVIDITDDDQNHVLVKLYRTLENYFIKNGINY